ncbi:MAG: hypothetical protein AAF657_01035 [Acidobacteriota bacterium]
MQNTEDQDRAWLPISFTGLLALKVWVAAGVVLFWNAAMVLAFELNHGSTEVRDERAMLIVAMTLAAVSTFCGLVAGNTSFRRFVLAERRRHLYNPGPFVFIAFLTSTMLLIMLAVTL